MSGASFSLRRRLVLAFALFALATALCFSAFSVLFVYSIEDSFFSNMLKQEVAHQRLAHAAGNAPAAPIRSSVTVHDQMATFPADLARQLAGAPQNGEFFGEQGRHYHVRVLHLDGAPKPMFLVAEISAELVVRPSMPFLLSFLGISILAILVLTIGIGYWLAWRATAPLSELAQLVAATSPARLPRQFSKQFPDNEIGVLARALEQALARTADFIEREQHFTRDASHELRTPLAVIEGAARLVARQSLPAAAGDQVQRILGACADMAQTVDTLLALAREELSAQAPESLALLPLVESTVVRFAHLLDGKQVELSIEIDPATCVVTHRSALAILLANLLSNAFGHTGQGEIAIRFEAGSLLVSNSSPPIPAELKERLYQAGAKGAASAGFGLGLSIARRLGEQVGIGLEVESMDGATRAALHFSGACTDPRPHTAPAHSRSA